MSRGNTHRNLFALLFIFGLALLAAQWATAQSRFNVQSSGRGLQNAKMGAQINQLQAENDAQQAELDAKKPHADATLATCGVGSGTVNNKITWNAGTNTWGCIEETDPNVQDFALDSYTAPVSCASGQILTMESKKLKCTASSGTNGFEVDPTVFDFTHNTYSLPSCAASQVLTLKTIGGKQRLGCVSGSALSNFEVDPTVYNFAKKALPVCGAGEILTADGTDFVCVNDGEGVTMEVDPTVKSFAKNNLPNCTGNQVLKANGSALSCISAVTQSAGNNAGTLDGLNSTQFLRSDANDTATGILTLNNQVRVNSYLMQNQGGSYDVWLQGSIGGNGTARNLALLGVKSSDTLYVNYNREYTGGTIIGGPVTINGGDFATNAGHIWSAGGHVGRDANNSIRFDNNTGAYWRIGGVWEYYATPTAFRPYPHGANDLGVSGARWRHGYFSGTVYAGNFSGSGAGLSGVVKTETDPQVGALTNGRWCRTNGSTVICDRPVPVTSETDPQVNSVTSGKWCRGISGGRINCDQNAPSAGITWGETVPSGGTCSMHGRSFTMSPSNITIIGGRVGIMYSGGQGDGGCGTTSYSCTRSYTTSLSSCSCRTYGGGGCR